MPERLHNRFYASLLGGFSLSFGGQQLSIEANPQTKYMQIFLILIKAGAEGIERNKLVEIVRQDGKDRRKQMNNFRQHVHLLRLTIGRSYFPPGEYIVRRGSRYYFSLDYEVETDTEYLDGLLSQIRSGQDDQEVRRKLLWKFCKAYTGEFLPMLSGEEWVIAESAYYQKWYFNCLKELCGLLKAEGNFEQMLELCTAASQIHPYDEWQAVQIDCLMSMNRYQEAMKIYEDTAQIFYKDLGTSAVDRVMAKYQNRSKYSYYAAKVLSDVKYALQENREIKGAYYCSYPSFQDMYHVISRMNQKSLLMLCTVKGRPGWRYRLERAESSALDRSGEAGSAFEQRVRFQEIQDEWDRFTPKMELLRKVIEGGIRRGDVYTRYSANQFLVLLIGAGESNGEDIVIRLGERWNAVNGDQTTNISFVIEAVEGTGTEEDGNAEEREIYGVHC
ncbi:MAG: bacterial transcriptional activator domain-containing protein [Lachnospiraceae bacterium]|nr:bacterial transcriptional activator domain-containing protein [Lachnospiraceae bacterium]